mmetsp:Transcript_7113/g.18442  ORF Transcript_7113/g.18442 Transcript_7113/m.18442 type:complete len:299 (-) Transcript_7113:266-1162(-)
MPSELSERNHESEHGCVSGPKTWCTAPTHHVHAEVKFLPGGQKSTMNNTGFEMAELSPLHAEWVASYDGEHPLLDIGAAYGRNTLAAANILAEAYGTASKPRVLACDCDDGHLIHIDALNAPGVVTVYGRLPELKLDERVSGVLISEVLHFLSGNAIEETLQQVFKLLVPGGKLCITACAPQIGFAVDESGRCKLGDLFRSTYSANEIAGRLWPGEGLNPRESAMSSGLDWVAGGGAERLPTFFHLMDPVTLERAGLSAGFQVCSATTGWHPGYPDTYRNPLAPNRENTQVVLQKPLL